MGIFPSHKEVRLCVKYIADLEMMSLQLLTAIAEASSIYYNYTGQSECLNVNQTAVSSLDNTAWNFQVMRFVMIHLVEHN